MRTAAVVMTASFLGGCIALPIPHDRPYGPALFGTVVDADTVRPVSGATVLLDGETYQPSIEQSAITGNDGTFAVRAFKRVLWWPLWFGPAEGFCVGTATVTAPGYLPQVKSFRRFSGASGSGVCSGYVETWNVQLVRSDT
jgi:hypothetical protein